MNMFKSVLLLLVFAATNLAIAQNAAKNHEIKVGEMAPEIALPSPKGNIIALSSLRGNLVLIDFWASWCAPCVEEQPLLKNLYSKYNRPQASGEKFEIFGVSLDSKKPGWEKIIAKYKLPWTQVSDLKFWTSPVARTYNIQELPFNVLVDSSGKIIAINLHGKELERMVESVLK